MTDTEREALCARIDELCEQNAKLREQVERLHADQAHWELGNCPSCPNVADLQETLEQNAKLRELVRMMWKPFCWAQSGYDVCLTDEQDRVIRGMVRELGVEVSG